MALASPLPLRTARAEAPTADRERPRIGLVLGGGGARGAAHIGVIRVLEQLRIPIDYVAGTSMGSIVGGLYASGLSADELEAALAGIDWAETFSDRPPRADRPFRRKRDDDLYLVKRELGYGDGKVKFATGVLQGQKIDLIFESLTLPVAEIEDFDRLPTPYRAVATDLISGEDVVLGHGNLARAMRASMSVPAIFAPVELDGRILVDGGVANNVPVDVARAMGADIVIAVDVGSPALTRAQVQSVFGIASQLTWILTARNTQAQLATLGPQDILIKPELGDFSAADFEHTMTVVPPGVAAAEARRAALRSLSVSERAYRRYTQARAARRGAIPTVQFVRLDNQSRVSDEVVRARLHEHVGKPIDSEALAADIGALYGLENFESVRYEVVREAGRDGIVVHLREKAWGPNFLQLGMQLSATDDGDSDFNLGFLFKRTALNPLNGELRTGVQIGGEPAFGLELYQPLDYRSRYFIAPALEFRKSNFNLYEDGRRIAEYRVTRMGGSLGMGRTFGTWGELRLGLRRYWGDAEVRSGEPVADSGEFDIGQGFVRLSTDELDNINFPRAGFVGRLEWTASREPLGADAEYDQLEAGGLYAKSWGRHTGLLGLNLAATVSGDAAIESLFRLGGFLRLSGLATNELSGAHAGLARAAYMRRIGEVEFLPTYLGASLEAGNVWQDADDIDLDDLILSGSAFLGVDTFLGPLYLGLGYAEGGQTAGFLYLGRAFSE